MNYIEIIITLAIITLFIIASKKVYQDSKRTKAGLGCSGCRIADNCSKPEKVIK